MSVGGAGYFPAVTSARSFPGYEARQALRCGHTLRVRLPVASVTRILEKHWKAENGRVDESGGMTANVSRNFQPNTYYVDVSCVHKVQFGSLILNVMRSSGIFRAVLSFSTLRCTK